MDVIFLSDILITFNTAIYVKGNLNHSRKKIAIEYLKLWFWLDLVASFPYTEAAELAMSEDVENSENSDALEKSAVLLRMFKFFRFIKIIRLLRLAKLKVIFDKI